MNLRNELHLFLNMIVSLMLYRFRVDEQCNVVLRANEQCSEQNEQCSEQNEQCSEQNEQCSEQNEQCSEQMSSAQSSNLCEKSGYPLCNLVNEHMSNVKSSAQSK